jgi:arylsulfatase A-like enzyme
MRMCLQTRPGWPLQPPSASENTPWRRLLIASIGLLSLVATPRTGPCAEAARPNILLVVTDDQRPDTIRALGNPLIRTPILDRLVYEGTAFTRAITACPICVASRAELLTGRNGRFNGKDDFGFSPREGVPHWASVMQQAGYVTCYVGKWHTSGRPSVHGYAQTQGLYAGGGGNRPLTHPRDWKGMPVTGYRGWVFQTDDRQFLPERGVGLTPDISEKFADAAIAFLKSHVRSSTGPEDEAGGKEESVSSRKGESGRQPFFLHVNFTAPHDPLFIPTGLESLYGPGQIPVPENFAERHPFDHGNFDGRDERLYHWPRTREQTRRGLAVYYAVISHLDEQLGRILKSLQSLRLEQETLVIFTSDHGLAMGSHGLRGKQNMYEHSVGVPLIFRGPGIERGERKHAQCYLRDLYPTVCDIAGIAIPNSVQGRSLLPVLKGETDEIHDAVYAYFRDSQRMIRRGHWKFAVYPQAGRRQLFHLSDDPHEINNLADGPDYASVAQSLQRRLDNWRRSWNDPTLAAEQFSP